LAAKASEASAGRKRVINSASTFSLFSGASQKFCNNDSNASKLLQ
jgi:hypothetical protein